MTRKQERKRRTIEWLGIATIGAVAGIVAAPVAGIALAAACFGTALAIGHRRMIAPPGVAVLTYHSVSPVAAWLPWAYETSVHPRTFAAQLDTLAAAGCTVIATRDYVAMRESGDALPPRTVLIHFDDGYLDNYVHALPALVARKMPATFFPSLDFVEPGDIPRPAPADDSGYMNWAELRAIEAIEGLEIEPHGVDHARVPISDRTVDRLTPDNWRHHAWMQWRATPGPKHDWFRSDRPSAVPIGSGVPESGLALADRAWVDGAREDQAVLEARIETHLKSCRDTFVARLDRAPQIFCWPENAVGAEGRRIAAELGYRATTGGRQRNAATEPAAIISRIHVGDRALGFRWLAAERLHLRASVGLAHGNLYWYLVVGPMNWMRAIVSRGRRRGARA